MTLTEEVNALRNHSIYMTQRVYNKLDQVNLWLTKHDGLFHSLNNSMHEIVQAVRTNQHVDLRIYQMMIALDQLTAWTLTTVVEELLQVQDYLNTYEKTPWVHGIFGQFGKCKTVIYIGRSSQFGPVFESNGTRCCGHNSWLGVGIARYRNVLCRAHYHVLKHPWVACRPNSHLPQKKKSGTNVIVFGAYGTSASKSQNIQKQR